MNASLDEKLRNVKWGNYRLDKLFNIMISKSIDKNKIIFNGEGIYDYIGRSNSNNGIQGNINRLDFAPNPKSETCQDK